MNINYLILAHNNPKQLLRLVRHLNEPDVYFYIHIDKKANQLLFEKILMSYQNLKFVPLRKRKKIHWGDVSMVTATLELMNQVSEDQRNGYSILLSAQDYPITSNQYIYDFLKRNYGKSFISLFKIPHPGWENGGLPRLNKYKINKSSQRKHFLMLPSIFDREFYSWETFGKINFLRKTGRWRKVFNIFKKRKFPDLLEPFGGGQWWALPIEIVNRILSFHNTHPEYLKYHKYTLAPDEIFFHSIIAFLQKEKHFDIKRSLTYVNWERPSGPLPITFLKEDFDELKEASKNHLFARKFDIERDTEILDEIDKELLN
ncbi:beta-1,6-N-acetylglucosaminyltransferase [Salegentibacter salarius]|uniref:Peptide O-xylosyltransferase n=1 Tax=Salegentibacter salarius TaxID=435906 RepID=A0A2N0TQ99_9FLAO|nr:beta-1,6-N-acetylglucosaminyltransferase [Salegentibacter salarius]OEY71663.1 hypothetical protein BHS39_04695 [Salegentibacter salarius]PKD16912.1 hypothetical protein APR40_04695 [Salegentibacter salarius]SLJ90792.1 Core-2/I-Branching enzyme [Salegentibacter salarius]